MEQVLAFTRARVADAPEVDFCVDLAAGDLVAEWLMDNHRIDEPIMRAFLGLVKPGMRVLDLGCHIGTFSLPASALGAEVIAVDASPLHVNLMRHSARRNRFGALQVVGAAIAASEQPVRFIERSIHSHVQLAAEAGVDTVTVATRTVDELIEARGWGGVDAIKMDIEGNEISALAGMARMFARGHRPPIVFECNGAMLPAYGASICSLRETLAGLGYELLLIDHLRPGMLVQALPDSVQPECASDYIALAARPEGLAERWRIEPPLSVEQTVSRLLDAAASDAEGYRRYCADVIANGPAWLREEPRVQTGLRALEIDRSPSVRAACASGDGASPALAHADTPEPHASAPPGASMLPGASTPPGDAVVWATGLHLHMGTREPDLPPGVDSERRTGPIVLEDLCFHVRRGELLAVSIAPMEGSVLLSALAGLVRPSAGHLHVDGPVVLLATLGDGMEEGLTVAENMLLFAAFLGCHTPEVGARVDELAETAHATVWLGSALRDAPPAVAARLALTVALECAYPRLLLLDRLPPFEDEEFEAWAGQRVGALCAGGMAVVQVAGDLERALRAPERALWVSERRIRCCGHPRSVMEASWRGRFDPASYTYRSLGRARVRA